MLEPIHLLADSSLLFRDGGALLRAAVTRIAAERPSAVFVNASSGGDPSAQEIFEAAMELAGVTSFRTIGTRYSAMDHTCLSGADLIVLGGGDPRRGLEIMRGAGLVDVVVNRFLGGACLIGVSAGAVQLGVEIVAADQESAASPGLNLVPFSIDVHDESSGWARLRRQIAASKQLHGLGIPAGGGALFHRPDTLEPIGKPLVELTRDGDAVREHLLLARGDD